VNVGSDQAAGEGGGVDGAVGKATIREPEGGGVEKAEVKTDVMTDDDRGAQKLEEGRQHPFDLGGRRHHRRRESGEDRDEGRYVGAGIDEGVEGTGRLAPHVLHSSDLGDGAVAGRTPGGFEVEYAERHLEKGSAQIFEGLLPWCERQVHRPLRGEKAQGSRPPPLDPSAKT